MKNLTFAIVVAATTVACITVNIYFPAPAVRQAAEEIVDETWGSGASATPTETPLVWLPALPAFPSFGPAVAHAADPNINVSTAAIRALKGQIADRAPQLKPYLGTGNVGIENDGDLVVRNLDGVGLKDKAVLRRLIEAENRDRSSLYAEIAKANDFGSEKVDEIRAIFAETWIAQAEKGWWVEAKKGSWSQKK